MNDKIKEDMSLTQDQIKELKKLYDEYFSLQSIYFDQTVPPAPDVAKANIAGKVKAMKKVFEILNLKFSNENPMKDIDVDIKEIFNKYRIAHNEISMCLSDFNEALHKFAKKIVESIMPEFSAYQSTPNYRLGWDNCRMKVYDNSKSIGIHVNNEINK